MAQQQPEYGPSGYLPPRAAKRARKIMLREPMGMQWAIAAVIAGVLVLVAGGVLMLARSGPPGAPFVDVGALAAVDASGAARVPVGDDAHVLVVRGAGGVAVFADPGQAVTWCAASGHLESADGAVWEPSGRLIGGPGGSLTRLPAEVHSGVLHVDPTAEGQKRAAQPSIGATPAC